MANVDYTTMAYVRKPVVLTSVATLLGTNIKDTGRLCTSTKINKWAKFKPVNYAPFAVGIDPDTSADADRAKMLTIMKSKKYGLNVPSPASASNGTGIVNAINASTWDYVERTTPYHLEHFYFYNHKASSPAYYGEAKILNLYWDIAMGNNTVSFDNKNTSLGGDGNTSLNIEELLSEINSNSYYLCLMVIGKNNSDGQTYYRLLSATTPISNTSMGNISLNYFDISNYSDVHYWMCASLLTHGDRSGSYPKLEAITRDSFIGLPCNKVTDNYGSIDVVAELKITYDITHIAVSQNMPTAWTAATYYKSSTLVPSSNDSIYYYMVRPDTESSSTKNYCLWVKVLVTNTSNVSRTYNKSVITFAPADNFAKTGLNTATSITNVFEPAGVYDDKGNAISTITVGPNSSITLIYQFSSKMLAATSQSASIDTSKITTGQKLNMTIYARFGTNNGTYGISNLFTTSIRLRN